MELQESIIECRTAQSNNLLLHTINPDYFPRPSRSIRLDYLNYQSTITTDNSNSNNVVSAGSSAFSSPYKKLPAPIEFINCNDYTNGIHYYRAVPNLCFLLKCGDTSYSADWYLDGVFKGDNIMQQVYDIKQAPVNDVVVVVNASNSSQVPNTITTSKPDGLIKITAEVAINDIVIKDSSTNSNKTTDSNENRNAAQQLKLKMQLQLQSAKKPRVDNIKPPCPPGQPAPPPSPPPPASGANPSIPSDWTVTCLGTGCASPSRYRSNTCILINNNQRVNRTILLLDVGEGMCYLCSSVLNII